MTQEDPPHFTMRLHHHQDEEAAPSFSRSEEGAENREGLGDGQVMGTTALTLLHWLKSPPMTPSTGEGAEQPE